MARSFGKVLASRNADDDWRGLSRDAQWLYDVLISQTRLTLAGSLDVMPARWAQLAAGTSADDVEQALDELAAARFVVVDRTTEEVVIRTFVRHDLDNNRLNSNLIKGLWSAWAGVISADLRKVVVDNLPEIVWEKSGKNTPDQAEQMRRSPRLEPPVPTTRSNGQFEPPVRTNGSDGTQTPREAADDPLGAPETTGTAKAQVAPVPTTGSNVPSEPPSPSPVSVSCNLEPAVKREPRAMALDPDSSVAAGSVDNSVDEVIKQAAGSLAWAETDRRAGEVGNPEGYQRSRIKPIRRQHEPAWRQILEREPSSTPQQLVDAVTGHEPATRPDPTSGQREAARRREEAGLDQTKAVLATPPADPETVGAALAASNRLLGRSA